MWLPSQTARFVGMHVDAAHQRFILPEEKKQDLKKTADSVPQSSVVFNRQLAQLAGKMVPLWAGAIYKAMVGEAGWDKSYPSLSALKADIQRYKDILAASQGGSWWKRQHALLVAGDPSEYACAAYTPGGEFAYPMVVSYTEEELALMSSNQFSSTLREILCIHHLVQILLEVDSASIQHQRLRYRLTVKLAGTVSWA